MPSSSPLCLTGGCCPHEISAEITGLACGKKSRVDRLFSLHPVSPRWSQEGVHRILHKKGTIPRGRSRAVCFRVVPISESAYTPVTGSLLTRRQLGLDQGQLRRSPWKQVRRSQLGVSRSRGSQSTLGEQTFCLAVRRSWVRVPPGPLPDSMTLRSAQKPQGVLFQPCERPRSV